MSIEDFKKKYPGQTLQLDSRKKGQFKCQYCDRIFQFKNGLQAHIKIRHPQFYEKINVNKEKGHFQCKICGKFTNHIYNHVTSLHLLDWNNYCIKYNQDNTKKSYFTEKHIEHLSQNKKNFYNNTDRGKQLKKIQRQLYSGQNNPAKKISVRSKISAAAAKKASEKTMWYGNRGIMFSFFYKDKKYFARSFEELKTIYTLIKNNIQFKYEKKIINYINQQGINKHYVVDFLIGDDIIELKCDKNKVDYRSIFKYKAVSDILSKIGKQFLILDYNDICKKYNIDKPLNQQFYDFIKELLKINQCQITYCARKNAESRILKHIDENYKNNKNIKIIGVKNK